MKFRQEIEYRAAKITDILNLHESLRRWLVYEPQTGLFRWRAHKSRARVGAIAGTVALTGGYIEIRFRTTAGGRPRRFLAHRLAWYWVHNVWPKEMVDHIDGDRQNNKISNLRLATIQQNSWNSKQHRDNRSGLKGVTYCRRTKKWTAAISIDRRNTRLGYFNTPIEAARAYRAKELETRGEYARAN